MRSLLYSIGILFFFLAHVSALGITPAVRQYDFQPGQEVSITFTSLSENPDQTMEVVLGGDFAQYATSSAQFLQGTQSFTVTMRFPDQTPEPGKHTLSVLLREQPPENVFIGTAVEIGAVMSIIVPYPGIYGEISLNIPDGNVDEQIPIELHVVNRGSEELEIQSVAIDFIHENSIISTMDFTPLTISSPGDRYFRRYLDTTGYRAGNYQAVAKVKYNDEMHEKNQTVRIGSLFVNITNFTTELVKKGVQPFHVSLESRWNNPIPSVHVDVVLNNSLGEGLSFRMPSVDLGAWQQKTAESYIDTEKLEGSYNIALTAVYSEQSTTVYGKLEVVKPVPILLYSSIALLVVILIVTYFVVRHFKRSKTRKK